MVPGRSFRSGAQRHGNTRKGTGRRLTAEDKKGLYAEYRELIDGGDTHTMALGKLVERKRMGRVRLEGIIEDAGRGFF